MSADWRKNSLYLRSVQKYPETRVTRITFSLVVFMSGWVIWWISMFLPGGSRGSVYGPVAISPWGIFVLTVVGAFLFPVVLIHPFAGMTRSELPLLALAFVYIAAIFTLWWPVLFRSRYQWAWRIISIGTCVPLVLAVWG